MNSMKKIFIFLTTLTFCNCLTVAETRTNTIKHTEVKKGTYSIVTEKNDIKANFIGKLIEYKIEKLGFQKKLEKPDYIISTAYTVKNTREIKKS